MRKVTSAGLRAGVISGLVAGIFVWGLLATWSWNFTFSTMSHFAQTNFPLTTSSDVTVSAVSLYAFVLVIVLAISSLLGAFTGLVFVKLAIRFPVRSVYLKAFGFAFCLWLISTIPGLFIQLVFSEWYLITLVIFECDSLLYAYIFRRWSALAEWDSQETNSSLTGVSPTPRTLMLPFLCYFRFRTAG